MTAFDYGTYYNIVDTSGEGDFIERITKDGSGHELDGYPGIRVIAAFLGTGPSYVPPATVTYATPEDYYESPQWQAAEATNEALQVATAAVTAITDEIEKTGMTPELNDALNSAARNQEIVLRSYQNIEPAQSETYVQAQATVAVQAAQNAVETAAQVAILPPDVHEYLQSTPAPVPGLVRAPETSTESDLGGLFLTAATLYGLLKGF